MTRKTLMIDKEERIADLVKMLMELRMCTNAVEARKRALEIIASTDAEGPTVANVTEEAEEQPEAPAEPVIEHASQATREDIPEVANVREPGVLKSIDTFQEMKAALANISPEQASPLPEPAAPPKSELDTAVEGLADLEEDESKEALNEKELEEQMRQLRHELENSRREVEMLRTKLTKTEEALSKAQQAVNSPLPQPAPREPMPNHEKPRGTNPPIDRTKVFGRR